MKMNPPGTPCGHPLVGTCSMCGAWSCPNPTQYVPDPPVMYSREDVAKLNQQALRARWLPRK